MGQEVNGMLICSEIVILFLPEVRRLQLKKYSIDSQNSTPRSLLKVWLREIHLIEHLLFRIKIPTFVKKTKYLTSFIIRAENEKMQILFF